MWQFSYDRRPFCHSWQDRGNRSVSAMIVLALALGALAVAGIAGTVVLIAKDGYRAVPTRPRAEPAIDRSTRTRREGARPVPTAPEPHDLIPARPSRAVG